jgi:hypothetical protein
VATKTSEDIQDVTDKYSHCLKAERRGENVLVLEKLETPIKRLDSKRVSYMLTHYWLTREAAELCQVQGDERSYWSLKELEMDKQLFDQFNLF